MDEHEELLRLRASRVRMAYMAIKALACDPINGVAMVVMSSIASEAGYSGLLYASDKDSLTLAAFKLLPQVERDLADANRAVANLAFSRG